MPLKIIVCGGGVGGLAAAAYLRARHAVTVLERGRFDFSDNDYGLSIFSNAFCLLEKAGVKKENLDMVRMTHFWIRNSQNQELTTVPLDPPHFGFSLSAGLKRTKLQKEMFRLATSDEFSGRPAKIVRDAKITRVDAVNGKVWTAAGECFQGDLVIGADGIGSIVRPEITQEPWPTQTHGLLAFITTVPLETIQNVPELEYLHNPAVQSGCCFYYGEDIPQFTEWTGKRRILIYQVSPSELQVLAYAPEDALAEQFDTTGSSIIKNVSPETVTSGFSNFSPILTNLFEYAPIDAWRIRDIKPLDRWVREKAVLIGDASHAMVPHSGLGCNLAIEDAEALGYFLKDVADPIEVSKALVAFEASRKDRVGLVGRIARQIAGFPSAEDKTLGKISLQDMMMIYPYQGTEHFLSGQTVMV